MLLRKFNDILGVFQKGTVMTVRHVVLPIKIGLIALLFAPAVADHKEGHLASLHSACAYHAVTQLKGQILDVSFSADNVANGSNLSIDIRHSHDQSLDAPKYRSCHVRVLNDGTIKTLSFDIYSGDEVAISAASSTSARVYETASVSSAEEDHTSIETTLENNNASLAVPVEAPESGTSATTESQNLSLSDNDHTENEPTTAASSTTTVE